MVINYYQCQWQCMRIMCFFHCALTWSQMRYSAVSNTRMTLQHFQDLGATMAGRTITDIMDSSETESEKSGIQFPYVALAGMWDFERIGVNPPSRVNQSYSRKHPFFSKYSADINSTSMRQIQICEKDQEKFRLIKFTRMPKVQCMRLSEALLAAMQIGTEISPDDPDAYVNMSPHAAGLSGSWKISFAKPGSMGTIGYFECAAGFGKGAMLFIRPVLTKIVPITIEWKANDAGTIIFKDFENNELGKIFPVSKKADFNYVIHQAKIALNLQSNVNVSLLYGTTAAIPGRYLGRQRLIMAKPYNYVGYGTNFVQVEGSAASSTNADDSKRRKVANNSKRRKCG